MAIGYFSAAEGIVGDNIQHVTRELVTAPRAQARPRTSRSRGKHPRGLSRLHDQLTGDQPARV